VSHSAWREGSIRSASCGPRGIAAALVVWTALGLAAESCGVFSSGACADKATCRNLEGGSDDGGSDGVSNADVVDTTVPADGASDDVSPADSGDATGEQGDAANDVVTGDDVGDVTVVDAPADVPLDAPDACPPAVCADAGCTSGNLCAPPAPAMWTGPALLWSGPFGSAVPPCPMGYEDAFDANAGPTGSLGSCSCTCVASGQLCSVAAVLNGDAACLAPCGSATVSSACTVPTSTCGSTISMNVTAPAPSGGSCTANVSMTGASAPGWQTAAHVCLASAFAAGCNSEACVPAPIAPYGTSLCVYQMGTSSCPTGYPHSSLFFSGENDGRVCAGCSCSGPTGGSCSGSISVYGITIDCTAVNPAMYTLGSNCRVLNVPGSPPTHIQGNFTVTQGTCTVQGNVSATGAVTGTGPITVCCM
jgi:hypothetical protein